MSFEVTLYLDSKPISIVESFPSTTADYPVSGKVLYEAIFRAAAKFAWDQMIASMLVQKDVFGDPLYADEEEIWEFWYDSEHTTQGVSFGEKMEQGVASSARSFANISFAIVDEVFNLLTDNLSVKLNKYVSDLQAKFAAWTPISNDGGATLKTLLSSITSSPTDSIEIDD